MDSIPMFFSWEKTTSFSPPLLGTGSCCVAPPTPQWQKHVRHVSGGEGTRWCRTLELWQGYRVVRWFPRAPRLNNSEVGSRSANRWMVCGGLIYVYDCLWISDYGGLKMWKEHERIMTFHSVGNNTPNWLIFLRGVETTNHTYIYIYTTNSN